MPGDSWVKRFQRLEKLLQQRQVAVERCQTPKK